MEAVRKDFPATSQEELKARSLDAICKGPEAKTQLSVVCDPQRYLTLLRRLALVTILVTLAILALIHYTGRRCRRNRALLLKVFRPSAYMITFAIALLVVSHSILFVTALSYGTIEFLNTIFSGLVFVTVLGCLVVIYRIIRVLLDFNKEHATDADGKLIAERDAPKLWDLVRDAAKRIGTEPPRNIILGIEPQFFVTEVKVNTEQGPASGRTLYLSLSLCRILTFSELRAIVGHEMAHFHGQDTEFSRNFYPVFRHGADTLGAISGIAQSPFVGFAFLPAIWMLSFYYESFGEVEASISRDRELAADAAGAGIASGHDLAAALTKLTLSEHGWERTYSELLNRSTKDEGPEPLPSNLFRKYTMEQFREKSREENIAVLENERLTHPTDSHPPLQERAKALGFAVADIYDAAMNVWPADPSSNLLPDLERLEREIMPVYTPVSDETQAVFQRRQPGFVAMEYHSWIFNRTFLIYLGSDGLYGIRFAGTVDNSQPEYFKPLLEVLEDPWFFPGTKAFKDMMAQHRTNFFISYKEIAAATFDTSRKWGMGKIPHSGKLRVKLTSRKTREFVLLGDAYGDGISRSISRRLVST